MNREVTYKTLADSINSLEIDDLKKKELFESILRLKKPETNLLIIGATGSGKSSTINALFGSDVAKVGTDIDSETMEIEKYEIGNLVIWDSPGLGDSEEIDATHTARISSKLTERNEDSEHSAPDQDFCL